MNVLEGPRRETRRIFADRAVHECIVEDGVVIFPDGRKQRADAALHAPPTEPRTIVCVHLNYRSRAEEFGVDLSKASPTYFLKPAGSLNTHRGEIQVPADCRLVNYEGEIAAVVGRPMKDVRPEAVWSCLAGFTCANDVGAHDFRDTDAGSMLRVKGQDGFCPLGPGLVRGVDIRKSGIRTFVNGDKVQEGAVEEMLWGIDELLSDVTRHITLAPGDVVLTGTPWHSRPIFPGDLVEVEVDGIGRLSNQVVWGHAPENGRGFPATVTKTSLAVALGSDYRKLKDRAGEVTPEHYLTLRSELVAANMSGRPPRKDPR